MADISMLRNRSRRLKEGLRRTQMLTESMLHTYSSPDRFPFFDLLEAHTHIMKTAHDNIDNTLKELEEILTQFDICHKACLKIAAEDPVSNFCGYMKSVDEIHEAILFFTTNSWLRGSNEALQNAEASLLKAMLKLEALFKSSLMVNSYIIEPPQLINFLSNIPSHTDHRALVNSNGSCDSAAESFDYAAGYFIRYQTPTLLSPGCLTWIHEIARRMITAGYSQKCLNAYREIRYPILEGMVQKLGVELMGSEDSKGSLSEGIETKVAEWPRHLQVSVQLLLAGEQKLCDQIFYRLHQYDDTCFVNVTKNIMFTLLNFADKFMESKMQIYNLLPILKMYMAMHHLYPQINAMFQSSEGAMIVHKFKGTHSRLGRIACGMLNDFEHLINRNESSKIMAKDGTVHPLSTHVLKQVKLISNHQDEFKHLMDNATGDTNFIDLGNAVTQMVTTLLTFLDTKSKHYKDDALGQLFLMNNVHYIVCVIQRCNAKVVLGEDWVKKHQTLVQIHAKNYQHAAWDKVLQCLSFKDFMNDCGCETGIGISRSRLKERFKVLNHAVEERHRCQMQWTVPDPELRKALQKAVMDSILPAYSTFLRRFSGTTGRTKNPKKYIKYTVKELELLLEDLFEGKNVQLCISGFTKALFL